jgi:hypothetical protein
VIHPPKTKEDAAKMRYSVWAGNPKGYPYKPIQCAWEASSPGRFTMYYQCNRKPGHGPDGL